MAEIKRNAVIVKALGDISLKTVGIRHKLNNSLNLRPLKGHTARHNKTDVAGTEDEHLFAHHIAFHIDISLGGSGGENAGGAFAGNGDGAAGSFAAAHGKNNGARVNFHIAFFLIDGVNLFLGSDGKHHGIGHNLNAGALKAVDESLGIFRTGKLLFENVKAKAGMYALVKDTAKLFVTLNYKHGACPVLFCFFGSGKARRAAAHNNKIVIHQRHSPFAVFPVSM